MIYICETPEPLCARLVPGERRALALSRLGAMTALDVILLASPGEEVKRRPLSPSVTTIGRSATHLGVRVLYLAKTSSISSLRR